MAVPMPMYDVALPFVGIIDGGFYPGRMVRIQGLVLHNANRFAINLQCGPNTVPRDDIALHVSCRFPENMIVRNTLQNMSWGPEESYGNMPLMRGQRFEIILLCEPDHYKIAVNGQHFTEYPHRIPYQRVSHLAIDGEVNITMICYEGASSAFMAPPMSMAMPVAPPPMAHGYGPPPVSVPGAMSYPVMPGAYPPAQNSYTSSYSPSGGPPYTQQGYGAQTPYGQTYPPPPPGSAYPPPPPGYNTTHKQSGGILGKAQAAISSVLGPKHGGGGMGIAGTALGAGVAGAALSGHLSPKKALKAHKKSHKKALKYGLPLAGAGLGAYALSRGFHSGSSSSSSSSEEE